VLVCGPAKKVPWQVSGRTDNIRVVNFDGGPEWTGRWAEVEITRALPNSLQGRLVSR